MKTIFISALIASNIFASTHATSLKSLQSPDAPTITRIIINTPSVGVYDKFEVQADVATLATNLNFPYAENAPPGLTAKIGISVDGLFSNDNFATTIVQPAFVMQPFTHTVLENAENQIPNGTPVWMVRFAPQKAGAWQFKLRARDAGGETTSEITSFSVGSTSSNLYKRHGFLHVSKTDKRYFEFSDGTPFIGVGFDSAFSENTAVTDARLAKYEQNKINFLRVWMSGASINGTHWTSWGYIGQPISYLPLPSLALTNTFNGGDVAMYLNNSTVKCLGVDHWHSNISALPNTDYTVSVRAKLSGVAGTASDAGFVVKHGGWLGDTCSTSVGTRIIGPQLGSTDWVTLTGTYKTGANDHWFGRLFLTLQNATAGQVFIDEARVWRTGDPYKTNILREPYANAHMQFDPLNASMWDKYIELSEKRGVYVKLVIDEKNEWIRTHLTAAGTTTTTEDNGNFYAAPNTKVRFLMEAWWRYVIARWGYSTAIHSYELLNEGDPYNGNHHELTNTFAKYMHTNDPARHMATTSLWAAFPGNEFWGNTKFPDLDYADIHAYVTPNKGTQTAAFIDQEFWETDVNKTRNRSNGAAKIAASNRSASFPIVPNGLVIRGQGEWTVRYWLKMDNFSAKCDFNSTGSRTRLRWSVDGGLYNHGTEGVIPDSLANKSFLCTAPIGTFDWKQFDSNHDRDGNPLPVSQRLVLTDTKSHALSIGIENTEGINGTAWFDDMEVVAPNGETSKVIGTFDPTPMFDDTAWYNRAFGEVHGAKSIVGAGMPLVRGEAGLIFEPVDDTLASMNKDKDGVWLHNNVWGQVNPGGMYDLFWFSYETIDRANPNTPSNGVPLYNVFLPYRNFMEGIPLSNGNYKDAGATTSAPELRAWGQRDDVIGRMHLWVQNTQHTWTRVVSNTAISPINNGTITLPNVTGEYNVEWWNTKTTSNQVFKRETLTANGNLVLTLPLALSDDVAVKIVKKGVGVDPTPTPEPTPINLPVHVYLPFAIR